MAVAKGFSARCPDKASASRPEPALYGAWAPLCMPSAATADGPRTAAQGPSARTQRPAGPRERESVTFYFLASLLSLSPLSCLYSLTRSQFPRRPSSLSSPLISRVLYYRPLLGLDDFARACVIVFGRRAPLEREAGREFFGREEEVGRELVARSSTSLPLVAGGEGSGA